MNRKEKKNGAFIYLFFSLPIREGAFTLWLLVRCGREGSEGFAFWFSLHFNRLTTLQLNLPTCCFFFFNSSWLSHSRRCFFLLFALLSNRIHVAVLSPRHCSSSFWSHTLLFVRNKSSFFSFCFILNNTTNITIQAVISLKKKGKRIFQFVFSLEQKQTSRFCLLACFCWFASLFVCSLDGFFDNVVPLSVGSDTRRCRFRRRKNVSSPHCCVACAIAQLPWFNHAFSEVLQ